MNVLRVTLFACMVATIGCDAVRPARFPSEDLVVTPVRRLSALPDDCDVKIIDGQCRVDGGRVVCPSAPPPEKLVAELMLCTWTPEDEAKLRTAACRAGGDALMRASLVTHRCMREDFDTDARTGAAGQFYWVYRLDHQLPSETPP